MLGVYSILQLPLLSCGQSTAELLALVPRWSWVNAPTHFPDWGGPGLWKSWRGSSDSSAPSGIKRCQVAEICCHSSIDQRDPSQEKVLKVASAHLLLVPGRKQAVRKCPCDGVWKMQKKHTAVQLVPGEERSSCLAILFFSPEDSVCLPQKYPWMTVHSFSFPGKKYFFWHKCNLCSYPEPSSQS